MPEPSRSSDKQLLLARSKGLRGSREAVLINQPRQKGDNRPKAKSRWGMVSHRGGSRAGKEQGHKKLSKIRLETSPAAEHPAEIRFSASGCSCGPTSTRAFRQQRLERGGTQTPRGRHAEFPSGSDPRNPALLRNLTSSTNGGGATSGAPRSLH